MPNKICTCPKCGENALLYFTAERTVKCDECGWKYQDFAELHYLKNGTDVCQVAFFIPKTPAPFAKLKPMERIGDALKRDHGIVTN